MFDPTSPAFLAVFIGQVFFLSGGPVPSSQGTAVGHC
jgi:hypothetical protein